MMSVSRAAGEKTTEILSLSVTNAAYGITRLGDAATAPDRIAYLRSSLGALAGDRVGASPVQVKSFTIHENMQVALRAGNPGQAGLLAKYMLDHLQTHGTRAQPGGYDVSENPKGYSVIVIDVRVAIGGKPYTARVVKAPEGSPMPESTSPVREKTVAAAMRETVAQLAARINAG
jgi:hypothetical protein